MDSRQDSNYQLVIVTDVAVKLCLQGNQTIFSSATYVMKRFGVVLLTVGAIACYC